MTIVTPEGVRDGDPGALSGVTERRGGAVLAYAEQVAAAGRALEATADAFSRFRAAVVTAADPCAVDPERTLLRATRFGAAAAAPRSMPLRARLRGGPAACLLVPELLAARAERELTGADVARLARHLARCPACRSAEARFRAGERAYREAPDVPPPPWAAEAIMRALVGTGPPAGDAAPPRPTGAEGGGSVLAQPGPGAEPVPPTAADPQVADAADGAGAALGGAAPGAVVDPAPLGPEPPPALVAPAACPAPAPAATDACPLAPDLSWAAPPTAHLRDERQPTYEFDALPVDAFDAEPPPPEPPPRGSAAVRVALPILLALVALVAILVLAGVFRT